MKSSSFTLSIAIMGVPERRPQITKLLHQLDLPDAAVAWDDQHEGHVPNWWRAIHVASQNKSSHVLILEDDAEPCRDFVPTVQRLIELYPTRIMSFFSAKPYEKNEVLTLIPSYRSLSDVAVVYPRVWLEELRQDFLANEEKLLASHWQAGYGADEMRIKLRPQQQVWNTVPSLVQHGSPHESTLGHNFAIAIARSFIGHDVSALTLDWSEV
jgi:hypothetical protein